jgi:hypothetical protein
MPDTHEDSLDAWLTPPAVTPAGAERKALHVCDHCGGGLVHPVDWAEESPEHWRISMRCPDCDERHEGVFDREIVERLDDELDRASAAMLSDYRRLAHANMNEEIELFVRALDLDLIGPDDF